MSDTTSSNPSTNSKSDEAIEDAEVVGPTPESDDPAMFELEKDEVEPLVEEISEVEVAPISGSGPVKPFLALVAGGVLAAGLGFLAATFWWPQDTQIDASQISSLEDAVSAQQATLERLEQSNAVLTEALAQNAARIESVPGTDGIVAELETLQETLRRIEARVEALETRPLAEINPDGAAALQAQLEAFRQELDRASAEADAKVTAARVEAEQIEVAAADAAKSADRNAALAELKTALDTGAPLSNALGRLGEVPSALESVAGGVPTLASLQSDFPEAARTVLAATNNAPENASTSERLAAFLKRQTNARSLSPKEGDDADAVLSRAEARLASGDLDNALAELQALPDAAKVMMANWLSNAETRAAALAAHAELSATN